MVGAGFGEDIARFFFFGVLIAALVLGGGGFCAGYHYGKSGGCGYSVKIEKKQVDKSGDRG